MKPTEKRMSDASGTIREIDPKARTLTIEGLVLKKSFQVAEDVWVATKARPRAEVGDLKVGDKVEVLYEEEGPASIAHCIAHSGVLEHSKIQELKRAA